MYVRVHIALYNVCILCLHLCTYSTEPDTLPQDEPKLVVFYSMLVLLFLMFCFNCWEGSPEVVMKQNGTMVTAIQRCIKCNVPVHSSGGVNYWC